MSARRFSLRSLQEMTVLLSYKPVLVMGHNTQNAWTSTDKTFACRQLNVINNYIILFDVCIPHIHWSFSCHCLSQIARPWELTFTAYAQNTTRFNMVTIVDDNLTNDPHTRKKRSKMSLSKTVSCSQLKPFPRLSVEGKC